MCVLGQSHPDVEVVVVDDASSDETGMVVEAIAEDDPRVVYVRHDVNLERFEARRTGVEHAQGEYVLFADDDDFMETTFVERLIADVEVHGAVDILQATVVPEYQTRVSSEREALDRAYLTPPACSATGDDVMHVIFRDRKAPWCVYSKLIARDVAQKAYALLPHGRYSQGEDALLMFAICAIAQTWRGAPSIAGYHYLIQAGSSHVFGAICKSGDCMRALRSVLLDNGLSERYRDDFLRLRGLLIEETVDHLFADGGEPDLSQRLGMAAAHWDACDVVGEAYRRLYNRPEILASTIDALSQCTFLRKEGATKVVGLYHWRTGLGGVERVLDTLFDLFMGMGYEVVLITDVGMSDDTPVAEGVRRVEIPPFECHSPDDYRARAEAFQAALVDHGVDVLVYNQSIGTTLPYDVLLARMLAIPTVIFAHTTFQYFLKLDDPYFQTLPLSYQLANGVVCLSDVERAFWLNATPHVWRTFNKIRWALSDIERSPLDSHDVVWVGRICYEAKRPDRAVRIMRLVLQQVPDARLLFVGDSDDDYRMTLEDMARELGVEDSIVFCGRQDDVGPYFARSSVHLVTSEYEGYGLVIAEGKAFGVPSVMFDCPTTFFSNNPSGTTVVRQGDEAAAAEAVVRLLGDPALRAREGSRAREQAAEIESFDLAAQWREILSVVTGPEGAMTGEGPARNAWRCMWEEGYAKALRQQGERMRREGTLRDVESSLARVQADLDGIAGSVSFRAGRALTAPLRLLRDALARGKRQG